MQLINNLGEAGLEFGIVWLGANASNEILARAAAGEVFLFHHWYPSPLLAAGNFTQVFLPTHNPHQWNDERRDVNGSIASEFAPATIRKLFNAQKSEQYEELHVFLSKFELHTYHLDELLERAVGLGRNHNCIGADETLECRAVHEIVACDWLQAHPYVWDNFIPSHAHCEYGEHVQVFPQPNQKKNPCAVKVKVVRAPVSLVSSDALIVVTLLGADRQRRRGGDLCSLRGWSFPRSPFQPESMSSLCTRHVPESNRTNSLHRMCRWQVSQL
eukprot:SAG31_NODE_23_length_33717_cov_17.863585_27_plen_272_part_00